MERSDEKQYRPYSHHPCREPGQAAPAAASHARQDRWRTLLDEASFLASSRGRRSKTSSASRLSAASTSSPTASRAKPSSSPISPSVLSGLEKDEIGSPDRAVWKEVSQRVSGYYAAYLGGKADTMVRNPPLMCTGPITYTGHAVLQLLRDGDGEVPAREGNRPRRAHGGHAGVHEPRPAAGALRAGAARRAPRVAPRTVWSTATT